LRTAEFLWQEGHTAHASKEEAIKEAETMLDVYAEFAEQYMAMPVIKGRKTASERFAGAEDTLCIEAMMQDGKALQAGTSHFLGQNFAKAFEVKFADKEGKLEYVWATSWGVSTRLMGALIMTHSDDEGLVAVPIYRSEEEKASIVAKFEEWAVLLKAKGISFKIDDDDNRRPGWKFAEYEVKGVPVRLALGPRDMANNVVEVARRDTKEKTVVSMEGIENFIENLLHDIQTSLFNKALAHREANTRTVETYEEFKVEIEKGGFILAHWDGTPETESKVKEETQATIRCIALDQILEEGKCMVTGKPSTGRVIFAKAY
jgi:prolyl-tRNA synthetase